MTEVAAVETKTRREAALEQALAAVLKVGHSSREVVADMLIGLITAEGARRRGEPVRDESKVRRALHVELVRMGLPAEVLAALKGA